MNDLLKAGAHLVDFTMANCQKECFLARVMVVHRGFGDARCSRDLLHRDLREAVGNEELMRGVEHSLPRLAM